MSERERNKKLTTFFSNIFNSFISKVQRIARVQQASVTRSTSVDNSSSSPPRVSEFPKAIINAAVEKLSLQGEAESKDEEAGGEVSGLNGQEVETIPISALTQDLISLTLSNEVLKDKWYEHELKRYTGSLLGNFFFSTPDRRLSQGSIMMIDMLNRREIKALFVVLITFGAHLLCWLPFLVYLISSIYWRIYLTASQETLILLVGLSSCIFDPIVYCLLNQPFRHATLVYCRNFWNSLEM